MSRRLWIVAGGGLGDQVCLEPVLRHLISRWNSSAEVVVATDAPEFFGHLPVRCVARRDEVEPGFVTALSVPEMPGPHEPSYHLIHPVDFIAVRLLRRTLPLADRTIRLQADPEALRVVNDRVRKLARPVLVHAGRSWPSKTFPVEVWRSYVRALVAQGFQPILIGREVVVGEGPEAERGCWRFDEPGVLDWTQRLSMRELIALIARVPVLVSNDSLPVHVAGAFDGWIGMIASAKRPDYVLPYRMGTPFFQAKSLERGEPYRQFEFDPLEYSYFPPMQLPSDVLEATAPTPSRVVAFVEQAYAGCGSFRDSSPPLLT